jgi:tetratricopeptide (TPR) repeat protein
LSSDVRGDLDWIVMKALEKDRTRRYGTAGNFAADVLRHLSDQPVEACPPTRRYRLKKFIRRNKAGVLAGSAVAAALVAGLVLASIGMLQARREAVRADREANIARGQAVRSEQFAHILQRMLQGAGPSVARGRDPTLLRELLDQTADRVQQELKDEPEIRADVSTMLGVTYMDIGAYEQAVVMYQRAVDGYRLAGGNESLQLARALGSLGCSQCLAGDVSSGKANSQLGLDIARKLGDRRTLAIALGNMARSLNSTSKGSREAIPFLRESLALQKQLGFEAEEVASNMGWLAGCLGTVGEIDEAESLARESLDLYRKNVAPDHPAIAYGLMMLGQAYRDNGKLDAAETTLREAMELSRRVRDKNDSIHTDLLRFVVEVLIRRGKWDDAEALIAEHVMDSPETPAEHYRQVGRALSARGHHDLATAALSKAIELQPDNATHYVTLGLALEAQGKVVDAIAAYGKSVEFKPDDPNACNLLAWLLATAPAPDRNLARAVELASRAVELAPTDGIYRNTLGAAFEAQGKLDDAIAAYRKAVELHPDFAEFYMNLGSSLEAQRKYEGAIAALNKAVELKPDNSKYCNRLAWLLATAPAPESRNAALAVELALRAVKAAPTDGNLWNTLGVAHYRAGHWQDAIEALGKSMERRGGVDASDWLFLAMAHWQLGHKDEARTWYDKAVEWTDQNQPKNEELRRFRAEAAELLGIPQSPNPTPSTLNPYP